MLKPLGSQLTVKAAKIWCLSAPENSQRTKAIQVSMTSFLLISNNIEQTNTLEDLVLTALWHGV